MSWGVARFDGAARAAMNSRNRGGADASSIRSTNSFQKIRNRAKLGTSRETAPA